MTAEVDRGEGTVIRLQLRAWADGERIESEEDTTLLNGETSSGEMAPDDAP